jgi:sugar-specific transcriptional regulator TrmB
MLSGYLTYLRKSRRKRNYMKNTTLIETIKKLGLDDSEARVYLSALGLGNTSALAIARSTGIKRPTVYTIIESLKQKGLMSTSVVGFKRFFNAADPKSLEKMVDERRADFKRALPELSALFGLKEQGSFIKYYEGLAGIKSVYDTILDDLRPGDEYLIISNADEFINMDEEYFNKFIDRRAKLGLNVRTILQDTPKGQYLKKIEKNTNQNVRFFPEGTVMTANQVITPTRTVITQVSEPVMSIVIENLNITRMLKEQFEIIWRSLA